MAITDQIVTLMGGEIVPDSLPGKGTNISVYLKMNLATEQQIQQLLSQKEPVSWFLTKGKFRSASGR